MRISLRQLAVFEAVARHESVSRGADDVAISQSAASMAIKELEEGLGITLFHRQGRKLTINENGRRLQPMARSLLSRAREIERMSTSDQLTGTLRIVATETIADYVLGPACGRFLDQHPGVQIKLETATLANVFAKVDSMACDLGFAEAPCNRKGLIFEPLISDELVVFCAPDHPLAARGTVEMTELVKAQWCLRGVGSSGRHKLTMSFADVSPAISIAFEADSAAGVKSAVRSGFGIGCLSSRALSEEFATGSLVRIDVRDLCLERVFGMLHHRHVYRGSLQESFSAHIRAMADQNIASRFSSMALDIGAELSVGDMDTQTAH
jgi:DNA-binding transcriptional LysR family regulator